MSLAEPFTLNVNPVFAELMSASADERRRGLRRPVVAGHGARRRGRRRAGCSRGGTPTRSSESAAHPELVGRRLDDVADGARRRPVRRAARPRPRRARPIRGSRCILANDDPDEVAKLLADDHCTLGLSDAGAHVGQLCDAPQATDFLGNWVRDRDADARGRGPPAHRRPGRPLRPRRPRPHRARGVGRRRRLRPRHGRPRPDPPRRRLPGRFRAPHRRRPDRRSATSSSTARRSASTARTTSRPARASS